MSSIEAVAALAEVEPEFVRRALESGALGPIGLDQLTETQESPIRLLHLWESAGFPVEAIGQAIGEGRLSFSFLDAPTIRRLERLDRTYRQGAAGLGIDAETVRRLFEAIGLDPPDLDDVGVEVGHRIVPLIEPALLAIYRRHRHHVWLDHTLGHVEVALDSAGLMTSESRHPSVVFVDLTGFTSLTEDLGDEVAAEMSGRLASMVDTISIVHSGRPVRWLGDGGMFLFREPGSAVTAGLRVVDEAPRHGLPPTHIGIHTGPLIFQDGDVYGRTVNMAARLSALAGPGEVLVSREVVERTGDGFAFEPIGPVELKGIAQPVEVYQAGARV